MSLSIQGTPVRGTERHQLYRLAPYIAALPAPPESWTLHEAQRDYGADELNGQMLRESKLFEATGERADHIPDREPKLWRTTYAAYEAACEIEAQDGLLPCGHSAFVNIGDGRLECKRCGVVHHRKEVATDE